MADVIKEYLVSLGFKVENRQLGQFNDALRLAGYQVTKMTGGMTREFAVAGTAVLGTLASVAAGTVALMEHTAQADLGYQLFARRMFMSTTAARELKIATDALGYSLEDIVWGPRELQERFHQLVVDQKEFMKSMGGEAEYAKQMRRVRDVEFQFTRLKTSLTVDLPMALTTSLGKALFGDSGALEKKLNDFNKWFIHNIPYISLQITTHLVPVLKDTWKILQDIYDISGIAIKNIEQFIGRLYGDPRLTSDKVSSVDKMGIAIQHVADSMQHLFDELDKVARWVDAHPLLAQTLLGAGAGYMVGGPYGAIFGGALGAGNVGIDALRGSESYRSWQAEAMKDSQWKSLAIQKAGEYKIDPGLLMGLIEKESNWNPYARNPTSGALGFGQFMPENYNMYGENARDPFQNMDMTARYLRDQLKQHHGDTRGALKGYGGWVTKDPTEYQEFILRKKRMYDEAIGAGAFKPAAATIGDIHVNITQPGASAEEIAHAVRRGVREEMSKQTQRNLVQLDGTYA